MACARRDFFDLRRLPLWLPSSSKLSSLAGFAIRIRFGSRPPSRCLIGPCWFAAVLMNQISSRLPHNFCASARVSPWTTTLSSCEGRFLPVPLHPRLSLLTCAYRRGGVADGSGSRNALEPRVPDVALLSRRNKAPEPQ